MQDFVELIPFIIAAAYYIFRPSKKKNQRRQDRPTQQPPTQQRSEGQGSRSFEDILRELMEGDQRPQPTPAYEEPEPEYVEEEKVESPYDAYTGEYTEDEPKKSKTITPKKVVVDPIQEEEAVTVDLRQAIIYDAILNRPEY